MPAILDLLKDALAKWRYVFSLTPGDLESPEGRSRERYRRVVLTGLTAAGSKGISIATSLIAVPLTLRYLGVERYGMWMTITSIVIMLGSADLGMGLGLVNLIADAMGREDREEARRAASSAFWMLTGIGVLLLIAAAIAYPFVPWSRLFNVRSAAAIHEAGPALMVFVAIVAANLSLGVINTIQAGLQNGFVNNLWTILGSLLSLGGLLLAIHFHAGLPLLILALAGPPTLAIVFNGVQMFVWREPGLRPSPGYVSGPTARRVLHTGLMFFLIQMCLSVGYQSDNIVIAQVMGAGAVASYAIPARLFNLVATMLAMLSGSMWPAYADAKARSDGEWIKRSFIRTTAIGTGLTAVVTLLLIFFGNRILSVWVGMFGGGGHPTPVIQASAFLLTIFGIRCVLNAYLQPINFLLNGLGELKIQVIMGSLMAALNITLSILFVRRYGVVGAVLGTVVAETVVLVIPMTFILNRTLRKLTTA